MPGAGNIIGANYVYGVAKPDGLTLGAVNPALYFDQLVGRSEVKFDWAKFNWIGSPEKNDIVSYMRADTSDQNRSMTGAMPRSRPNAAAPARAAPAITFRACSKKPSASRPRSSAAIPARRTSSWPSSAAKCFAGRRSRPPTSAASPIGAGTRPVMCGFMVQTGAKRDPRLKDTPTLNELMQQYKSPEPAPPARQSHSHRRHLGPPHRRRARRSGGSGKDPARRLRQSHRRSRAARRSRQTKLGSRRYPRRRAASVVERSHGSAQRNHRAHEVGARAGMISILDSRF